LPEPQVRIIKHKRIEHRCPRCRLLMTAKHEGRLDGLIKNESHTSVLGCTMISIYLICNKTRKIVPKSRHGHDLAMKRTQLVHYLFGGTRHEG
jgi:hypothetical protein